MAVVFDHPKSLLDVSTHFCPGCGHGIVHRLVCEVIDEMGIEGDTIGVVPVGCSVMSYNYFGCDVIEAPHGRAPAVATGAKRVNPDKFVFSYQGDGDLAAIGTAETVHVGTRGENIVVIFINNTTYGMTGGQMAPTTLPGQVTQTTPFGRNVETAGYPIRICEMMATLSPGRLRLCRAGLRHGYRQHQQGQEGHQEGIPEADERRGLHLYRGAVHLPHQLGYVSHRVHAVRQGQDDPLLSAGRI